jgi:hypothetical protein
MNNIKPFVVYTIFTLLTVLGANAQSLGDYAKSQDELEVLMSRDTSGDRSILKSDPRMAALVDILADDKTYLTGVTFGPDDLAALATACKRTNDIVRRFILFGVKDPASVVRNPGQVSPEVRESVTANLKEFQPEIAMLEIFGIRCGAKEVTLASDHASAAEQGQPVEAMRKGIQQMRSGSFGIFSNFLVKMSLSSFPLEYRRQVATALSETASVYVEILTPEQRAAIRLRARNSIKADTDDEISRSFANIVRVMESTQCERLCRY